MKTKEEYIKNYKSKLDFQGLTGKFNELLVEAFTNGINCQQDNKPVDVSKLRSDFTDEWCIGNLNDSMSDKPGCSEVFDWFEPYLSHTSEEKEAFAPSDDELKTLIWEEWESEIKEGDPRQIVFKYMKWMRDKATQSKSKTSEIGFVYWLLENCELIKDGDENVLWQYESEDYTIEKLLQLYKDSLPQPPKQD